MNLDGIAVEKLLQGTEAEKILGRLSKCKDFDFVFRILSINPFPVNLKLREPSFYKIPEDVQIWERCPKCGFKPLVWSFNNGEYTACGCYYTEYNLFSIRAESIMSYYTNHRTLEGYTNDLRSNWNSYCKGTLEKNFEAIKDKNGKLLRW